MKRLLLLLLLTVAPCAYAQQANVYVAETSAGSDNGSSCANAHDDTWFNNSANWGTDTTDIGPGTVVHICGTIDASTVMTPQGSGSMGSPITIHGEAGNSFDGDLEFTGSDPSWFIIEELSKHDGWIFLGDLSDNIIIQNNYIENTNDTATGDLLVIQGGTNITVQGNHFLNQATSNVNHDDMIQTYGGFTHDNIIIRYNLLEMNTTATNNKSCFMLEGITGDVFIYSNLFLGVAGGDSANCVDTNGETGTPTFYIYGNTSVSKAGGFNNLWNLGMPGDYFLRNNITYAADAGNQLVGDGTIDRDYNLWYGSGAPACDGANEICGEDPLFEDYASNQLWLATGSPAIGTGQNLSLPYDSGLEPAATWPDPATLSRSSWDMGGYVYVGSGGGGGGQLQPIMLGFNLLGIR